MRYHVVSYRELPSRLRINGLPCACKPGKPGAQYGPRNAKGFRWMVWDSNYICYGTRPMEEELHSYGPWLVKTAPFFIEVEKFVFERWIGNGKALSRKESDIPLDEEGEVLPKEIEVENRRFTRAFDRYYLGSDLNEDETRFVFNYMAPTYEADIDYGMNIDVNSKLIEFIASFKVTGQHVKILDYGVGTGISAYAEPNFKDDTWGDWGIIGLDIAKGMVKRARQKSRKEDPESHLLDAFEIRDRVVPLPFSSFHAAMACFTVHYFLDLQPYREIYRLIEDGAPFVCNVLENEIHQVESRAMKADLVPQRNRRKKLDYKVRNLPVFLLAFIKEFH